MKPSPWDPCNTWTWTSAKTGRSSVCARRSGCSTTRASATPSCTARPTATATCPAFASRPGRIDQAIEFPLPDDEGRRKLVALYGQDLEVSDEVTDAIVKRSDGVSPAFIKELMRRAAQFCLDSGTAPTLALADVENALDELLGDGSGLTAVLLGQAPARN
jgi:SpoVK/Ycf46/Vps4 family AAA+-type ATPase